ncbi:tetratricopeptide repeat protein [Streptomyces sp. NPDC048751]|uniref:tetratricopeptide repeat protein n=1 Tax=Streptomyces sp. NPDC048751 TaxID=3365591 RepID=UPI0037126B4E
MDHGPVRTGIRRPRGSPPEGRGGPPAQGWAEEWVTAAAGMLRVPSDSRSKWGSMASILTGRRREALILASGPVLAAAVGVVTNLITSKWSWGLFAALLVVIALAAVAAALVPGSNDDESDSARSTGPCTLPPGAAVFAGRDRELRQLLGAQPRTSGSRPLVCIITGRSGSGKTELAVQAAHLLAERYPAGQLFVSYRRHAAPDEGLDPQDVLATLLLAVDAPQIPTRPGLTAMSSQWQSAVRHKPFLIVLDDVDHTSQVLEVLPSSPRGLVLVTSRKMLPGIEADVHVPVDTLTEEGARTVLNALLEQHQCTVGDTVIDVLTAMYRLPLTVRRIADRIITEQRPLDPYNGPGHNTLGLEPMLATIQALPPTARLVLHRTALHPGAHVTAAIASALADVSHEEAGHALDLLHRRGLLMSPDPHCYGFHDQVLLLAQPEDTVQNDETSAPARERLFQLMACLLNRANKYISAPIVLSGLDSASAGPDVRMSETEALEWLHHHFDDLQSVARLAVECDWSKSWQLTTGLAYFMRIERHNLAQAEQLNTDARKIAEQSGDLAGVAYCRAHLGTLHRASGRYRSAEEHSRTAMRLFAELPPSERPEPRNEAYCASELSTILYHLSKYVPAEDTAERAVDLYRDVADRRGEANGLGVLGLIRRATGKYQEAREAFTEAYSIFASMENLRNQAWMLIELGTVDRLTGDLQGALTRFSEALDIYTDTTDRGGCAWARRELGIVHRILGNHTRALRLLEAARREFTDLCRPRDVADAEVELGTLHRSMGDVDAARGHVMDARDAYDDMGNRRGKAWAELELGALDVAQGQYTSAAGSFQLAQRIYQDIGDRSGAARALLELGGLALARGDRARARHYLAEAHSLYTALDAPQAAEAQDLLDRT